MAVERVSFSTGAGAAKGVVAVPAGNDKAPAVVLVQEYWGITPHIESLVERMAAAGFVTVAPDLYEGKIAKNAEEAGHMMQTLDRAKAVQFIAGAAQFIKGHARSNGHVGVIGFCMGGAFALGAAANTGAFEAVVPFYGVPPLDATPWDKLVAPVQAHFSNTDKWASPDAAHQIQSKLAAHGTTMELHLYDAEHAFMNDGRPEVYNPTAAKLAWERATTFLHKHLG